MFCPNEPERGRSADGSGGSSEADRMHEAGRKATAHREGRRRSPLRSIQPIADAVIDPSGEVAVEVSELCDRVDICYRVTGDFPPLVVLREGGGHVRGRLGNDRECLVVDVTDLPAEEPERSLGVLELLVRGLGRYQAQVSPLRPLLFSTDIVQLLNGRVVVDGEGNEAPLP